MCGVDRRIAQSTLAEVRACHLSGTDEVVPTFDEVLEAVGGRVPLIVELKVEQNVDSLCSAVRERMQRYNGLWCMESFDPRAVQWFRKNAPEIIRGQLAFGLGGEAAHKGVKPLTAFFISTLMQHVLSRPDFLAYRMPSANTAESADAPCAPDAPVDGCVDDPLAGSARPHARQIRHRNFRGLRAAGKTQLNPVKSDIPALFRLTDAEKQV